MLNFPNANRPSSLEVIFFPQDIGFITVNKGLAISWMSLTNLFLARNNICTYPIPVPGTFVQR